MKVHTAAGLLHASDFAAFEADPLSHLTQRRAAVGDVFLVREGGAVFSGAACSATVAVFGAAHIQQVLNDTELFAMPASSSVRLALPAPLAQLNRSLHSMHQPQHGLHKRALGQLLCHTAVEPAAALRTLQTCTQDWAVRQPQPLLQRMRELSLCLATQVLLGPAADPALAALLQTYFALRRQAASPVVADAAALRKPLLASGRALDRALRAYLRGAATGGVLQQLLDPAATAGVALSEDEAAGHANILFVSATEPVAVALTWTLLLLSQQAELRRSVRHDAAALEGVLLESLRLLPPNAFMARLTTQPVQLAGLQLPANCELMLCPFLVHREAAVFERPQVFLPQRWPQVRPTPCQFFPFGAGRHACVGRGMGMELLRSILGFVVRHYDVVLDGDQLLDWRVHVQFMPRVEIAVRFEAAGCATHAGRWRGPVAQLLEFDDPVPAATSVALD